MKNPFKRKKNAKKIKQLNKRNIEIFLNEITKSVNATFSGQESLYLENVLRIEVQTWLKNTILSGKELDPIAVRFGVCLGLQEALRKINEAEKEERASYIS